MSNQINELTSSVYEALEHIKMNPAEAPLLVDDIVGAVQVIASFRANENKPLPFYAMNDYFAQLIKAIEVNTADELYKHIKGCFSKLDEKIRYTLQNYLNNYNFWGSMNIDNNEYEIFRNRANALKNHTDEFVWLYGRLADYRSRYTLYAFINYWLNFNMETLLDVRETIFKSYFDPDIIKCTADEVIVDLGAYIGDTVVDYVNTYGRKYKKFYCYEISPETFNALKNTIEANNFDNIELRRKGAATQKGFMRIKSTNPNDPSANIISETGDIEVEVVTIDEDITEPVTLIKMDIEGAEQAALRGCAGHIKNNKPKLALSLYHNNEDIWKLPRMVDEICPGYKFYMRYNGGNVGTELTLLAVYDGG